MKTIVEIPTSASNYFDVLLNNIEEPIIATDTDFNIVFWNTCAQRVFKLPIQESSLEKAPSVLDLLYKNENINDVKKSLLDYGSWRGQLQYASKLNRQLTFEVSLSAIKSDESQITAYVGLYKNITAQKEAEKALTESLVKEHQLNDMKNRFVAMASHEFRTPFSTILSSSNLIEKYESAEKQPCRVKHIKKIKEAIHYMNTILEDFLSLGKLEEGITNINLFTFNLRILVITVIDDLSLIKKQGQTISYTHEGASEITKDKRLLRNILANLISNAIKFSKENQQIKVVTRVAEQKAEIEVIDEGIGISDEDQLHLFESFYRGKNAQCVEGTGLGLHIAQRYAELLKGEVQIESSLGIGTKAKVILRDTSAS
jgi:signal transduction histidine kinase